MTAILGEKIPRVDGPAKVTGRARYAAEFKPHDLAYAAIVESTIPKGRIARIDTSLAEAASGVLAVLSHETAPRLPYKQIEPPPPVDPSSGRRLRVFQDADILFNGQPIAVVVAGTQEEADHAAGLVSVEYEAADDAATSFEAERGEQVDEDGRGDAEGALARAPVTVEGTYTQAREQHHPVEPHATIALWDGGRLTLYDKTQWVNNCANEIAHVFGMDVSDIRVISPYVGGAFGSALRTWPHVTVAALAARAVGRPVRVELGRRDLFHSVGARPETVQRLRLGADRDGRLLAMTQEVFGETSTYEDYTEPTTEPVRKTYACENVRTRSSLVRMNTNTPTPMRAPGVITGLLSLEIAMDELAVALGMDPVELRLRNFADRDQAAGRPWTSNKLRECYRLAADRFGWSGRDPRPGSMKSGGQLVGWGMATAAYHAQRAPARALVRLSANGTALVQSASCDMGPGTYTAMTQVAAEALGLPMEKVTFELGDTDMPKAPVHGGSITMASVGNAVHGACMELKGRLVELARGRGGDFATAPVDDFRMLGGSLELYGREIGLEELLREARAETLEAEAGARPGDESKTYSASAFGAVFVEVRVDPSLGTVRVPRMIGAYDVGRVINPLTANSQCVGGMVGGLGMALLEQAEWDPRFGKVMNSNFAEYLVPVCADVQTLEAHFVDNDDRIFNPMGAKGLAEIAICGVAPAIANAVHHATGKRIRQVPITPELVLA